MIQDALASGSLDLVGLARPAMLDPSVPNNTLLDKSKKDDEARAIAISIPTPWLLKKIGNYVIGAGYETVSSLKPECDEMLTFNCRPGMEGRSRPWAKTNESNEIVLWGAIEGKMLLELLSFACRTSWLFHILGKDYIIAS